MLPDLLFAVGNSMQDTSREDYNLFNGTTCDRDTTLIGVHSNTVNSTRNNRRLRNIVNERHSCVGDSSSNDSTTLERIKLAQTPDLDVLSPVATIKIEEPSTEIYSWQQHSTDIGANLLRSSEDPLISSGATDDTPTEFSTIAAAAASVTATAAVSGTPSPSPPSAATESPIRRKSSRQRKRGQFKLKFHHQALPPGYLDHYEASQNGCVSVQPSQAGTTATTKSTISAAALAAVAPNVEEAACKRKRATESVRNWLQKISELQPEPGPTLLNDDIDMNVPMIAAPTPPINRKNLQMTPTPASSTSSRIVNYSDLPYMGEMTLENSKPRRGRKPKKADICHLIYKNYGTIFPGTPRDLMETGSSAGATFETVTRTSPDITKKIEAVQNGVKASLLEKRLTQKEAMNKEIAKETTEIIEVPVKKSEEPLNLCVRDVSGDTLILSSGDEDSDSLADTISRTPTPLISSMGDPVTDSLLAANLKMALPNFQAALLDKKTTATASPTETSPSTIDSGAVSPAPGYVYLPASGVFIHPMALYLHHQKLADSSTSGLALPSLTATTALTKNHSIKKESSVIASPKVLIPKNITQLLRQDKVCTNVSQTRTPPASSPAPSTVDTSSVSSARSSAATPTPQKRRRSAIFIPPLPAENTTNPATEVSICKFKFTGGAKPSLQEKKMLSVDSGGNFRYYSGTGDKSMRGYEFFPRESLQQSGMVAGSSAGAFLSASGERILPTELPIPSLNISNELLHLPELPAVAVASLPGAGPSSSSSSSLRHNSHSASERRKRKSRRSLQREKLEKTFKEKGFLIQTQQLESAEGATYCKFRQLRKFTRYLFRSWKDYLPGDIQHANATNGGPAGLIMPIGGIPAIMDPQTPVSSGSSGDSSIIVVEPTPTIKH